MLLIQTIIRSKFTRRLPNPLGFPATAMAILLSSAAVDSGNVYVADTGNHRIQSSRDGVFIRVAVIR
jgi:hypothetical protein